MLIQGKRVKKRTVRLPEPSGDRIGTIGSGPSLKLLILGDSGAAGVGADNMEESLLGQVKEHLSGSWSLNYYLFARIGATTSSTLKRLDRIEQQHFDVIVTSLGVNDVTSGSSANDFVANQKKLIRVLRDRFSPRQIIISGYPPVGMFPALPHPLRWFLGKQSRYFDRKLEQLAKDESCDYLNLNLVDGDISYMAVDGFHPSKVVYSIWGTMIAEKVGLGSLN